METRQGRGFLVGDLCVDLVLQIPEERGNARQQPEPEVHGGGTVANAAVALARLGIDTHFVGVAGDDLYGRTAVEELAREGIDVSQVQYSSRWPTMMVIAMIDQTGQRTVFGWPRRDQAFAELHEAHVQNLDLRPSDWLHTTGVCMVQETGCRATLAALDLARARGARTSFDLNLRLGLEGSHLPPAYVDVIWQAIERSDYVLGSADEELFHLIPGEPDIRAATAQLARRGGCVAIMREGAAGAHVSRGGEPPCTFLPFDVEVVDTLGAGDAFNAGFIQAGMRGDTLAQQVRRGHAVAGLQIGGRGARSAPELGAVERLLADQA